MGALMVRYPHWPELLATFIAGRALVPFAYGRSDCGMLAADWIVAATGVDMAADLRGRYRSAAGSVAIIRRAGHTSLSDLVTARLGAPVAPLLAQRGDIVEMPGDSGPALGICTGADAVCLGPAGLVTVPMTNAVRAWRV